MDQKLLVRFEVVDDFKFKISYGSPLLADHVIDYSSVSEDKRKGQPLRLLCASALSCYAGSLYLELFSRGAAVRKLEGTASPVMSVGVDGLNNLEAIDINVEIDLPDEDTWKLAEAEKLLNGAGCPVARHLSHPVQVRGRIERKN
ncbi:MAG: OsmC family protein [Spirochaetes bacterium]|nr:OsmC family protein [Spirochaetota bacterium]